MKDIIGFEKHLIDRIFDSLQLYFNYRIDKEETALDRSIKQCYDLLLRSIQQEQVSNDYILLPKELTYENGAKSLMSGEFEQFTGSEDGFGNMDSFPISWDTIKEIYKRVVDHYGKPSQPTKEEAIEDLREPIENALYSMGKSQEECSETTSNILIYIKDHNEFISSNTKSELDRPEFQKEEI